MSPSRGVIAALAAMLVAAFTPGGAAAEETVLVFEEATRVATHRPPEQGGLKVDSTRAEVIVSLGDHRVTVYEPDRVWVYDFEHRRVLNVDPSTRAYSDWSLFAYVAFSELELASCLGLRDRGKPPPGASVLELEALFSMRWPDSGPGPRESLVDSSRGDAVRVLINGRLSTSATPSGTTLTPARAAMFEHYLLYRCHLHPVARRALMRSGKVPQALFYRFRDEREETAVLVTLKQATSAPENNNPIRGLRQVDVPERTLATLAARLQGCRRCTDSTRTRWREQSQRFEAEALERGRYLDAILASTERAMGSCEKPSSGSWPEDLRKRAQADSLVQLYSAASRWKDAGTASESIRKLQHIDRSSLEKGYMLDLAVAKARLTVGDLEGGSTLLIAALAHNPCAVEAWMDLASTYMRGYQTVLAWLCFDAARAAAPPGCAAVAEGTNLERELLERHPEYFE